MNEKEENQATNKKKIIVPIVVMLILLGSGIVYLLVNKSSNENEIILEKTEESDAVFLQAAKDLLKYSNLEKVTGQILIDAGLLSEGYVLYNDDVVDYDNEDYYESETISKEINEEPTLLIRNYKSSENTEYSVFVSDNHTIKLELLNVDGYEFKGIYTEMDEKISDSASINVKELKNGIYKYYYDETFIEFTVHIDNDAPILGFSTFHDGLISVNFEDVSGNRIYYMYSTDSKDKTNKEEFQLMEDIELVCNTTYTVYVYAKDFAGNESDIYNLSTFEYTCAEE